MNILQDIINIIDSNPDVSVSRANKNTLYSLLNYLHTGHKGISKYDMNNFLRTNQFSPIFQELVKSSIIKENPNSNYTLNNDLIAYLTPFLYNSAE